MLYRWRVFALLIICTAAILLVALGVLPQTVLLFIAAFQAVAIGLFGVNPPAKADDKNPPPDPEVKK